jgi:hypothetical protein
MRRSNSASTARASLGGHPRLAVGTAIEVVRQVQGVQHQLGGLVQRVVVAVAEAQAGLR